MPTLNRLIEDGRPLERAALVVAAWALYLKGVDETGTSYRIPDPRAEFCQALVADDDQVRERVLGVEVIFGNAIPQSAAFVTAFELCYDSLRKIGVTRTLQTLLGD